MMRELVTSDLSDAWSERFESLPPVRVPRAYKGQRNFAGSWWFATTHTHVAFESWLERDHLMLLDFAPEVVAVAAQPFTHVQTVGSLARAVGDAVVVLPCLFHLLWSGALDAELRTRRLSMDSPCGEYADDTGRHRPCRRPGPLRRAGLGRRRAGCRHRPSHCPGAQADGGHAQCAVR